MRRSPTDRTKPPIGKKFNKLTVLGFGGRTYHGIALWRCECECGTVYFPRAHDVAYGRAKQCRRCAVKNLLPGGSKPQHTSRDDAIADLFREGHSFTEIARMFAVSRGTVSGAIDRLRKRGVSVERNPERIAA